MTVVKIKNKKKIKLKVLKKRAYIGDEWDIVIQIAAYYCMYIIFLILEGMI